MMYRAEENEVILWTRENVSPEKTVIATCSNERWAAHIATLLQQDYDEH